MISTIFFILYTKHLRPMLQRFTSFGFCADYFVSKWKCAISINKGQIMRNILSVLKILDFFTDSKIRFEPVVWCVCPNIIFRACSFIGISKHATFYKTRMYQELLVFVLWKSWSNCALELTSKIFYKKKHR